MKALLLILLFAASSRAAVLIVREGEDPQAAINKAQCGDFIRLQAGATFPVAGSFRLPNKVGCQQDITITTTDPSGTPAVLRTAYPNSYNLATRTFTRITPAMAIRMPKLVGTHPHGLPVILLDADAHHWKLEGLEITTAGQGLTTCLVNDASTSFDSLPHHITFEANYLHPKEEVGDLTTNITIRTTESAFIINGRNMTWRYNAIQGFTGRAPSANGSYRLNANSILSGILIDSVIEHNLLEANGQLFLSGGGAPDPKHTATATNNTYTSAIFSNTTDLEVGDLFAIYNRAYYENHKIQHPDSGAVISATGHYVNGRITSVNHATGAVTFTRLTGGYDYRNINLWLWGATGGTFTITWMGQTTEPITYNATKDQIKAALENLSTLEPEDFHIVSRADGWPYADFKIQIGKNRHGLPHGQWAYPSPINPPTINYTKLTGYARPPWIGGRVGESYLPLESSADGAIVDIPDSGAMVVWEGFTNDNNLIRRNIIAHHPEWTAVTGSVKGFAEVKGGKRTVFDGNIFSGEGTTIIWTVRNQGDGGSGPWSEVSYSKVTNNIFDTTGYTNAFILEDGAWQNTISHDIDLTNNLFLNPDMGHPNPWIKLQSGYNVRITHNTVFACQYLIQGASFAPSRAPVIRDNIFRPNGYLAPCTDGTDPCWPGAVISHNLIVNNLGLNRDWIDDWFRTFRQKEAWVERSISAVGFVRPTSSLDGFGDYRLRPDSPYHAGNARQASDGKDLGVDFDALYLAIYGTPIPPTIPPAAPRPTTRPRTVSPKSRMNNQR